METIREYEHTYYTLLYSYISIPNTPEIIPEASVQTHPHNKNETCRIKQPYLSNGGTWGRLFVDIPDQCENSRSTRQQQTQHLDHHPTVVPKVEVHIERHFLPYGEPRDFFTPPWMAELF